MAYVAPETVTPKIEIVDQPEEQAAENKRTFRFSLPIMLGVTLLAIFFLFQRRSRAKK
ncbi:hypothetical protein KDW_05360 [Dictyobacter vulcani]|uniref:Uncharacterized protein n=1 Tax=Dictyobacter vulcani TaxID=2607529 RepID=A0A5J4KC71_9CHLR|nr:TMEM208 family protein [Dictyobacter vulcani]GER86374.1 hypothetical protein KDW_05360 [Dictyobacter vulcani]